MKAHKKKKKIDLNFEQQLVERAKTEAEAFGELYDLYVKDIYTYIALNIGRGHDAEDLTSLTFEKALKNIADFKWQGFSFKSWLYKIAHNLIIDCYKKKKNVVSLDDWMLCEDIEQEDPLKTTQKNSEKNELLEALSKLPEDQREIVYLRYIKELSIVETVDATNKSVDSVKSLAKRALQQLRKFLVK